MNLSGDDYTQTFGDLYTRYQGYLRVKGGDNRPLPTYWR
jgi:hypothetical protein